MAVAAGTDPGAAGRRCFGAAAAATTGRLSPRSTSVGPRVVAGSRCSGRTPTAAAAGKSEVGLDVPEAEADELPDPFPPGSCPGPLASPARCNARSPGRRTCPSLVPPTPVFQSNDYFDVSFALDYVCEW